MFYIFFINSNVLGLCSESFVVRIRTLTEGQIYQATVGEVVVGEFNL